MSDTVIRSFIETIVREKVHSLLQNSNDRPPLVVANWKMNMTKATTLDFLKGLAETEKLPIEVVICPPYPYLHLLDSSIGQYSIGAQNVHGEESGAYTGDVSAEQLLDMDCKYVIIGHSERRAIGETDQDIQKKIQHSINNGLSAILCVGETEVEREQGKTEEVVRNQILAALTGVDDFSKLVIAYEPVWAIGTGKSASPNQAQEVHQQIRSLLVNHIGAIARSVRLLYGGSVKPENAGGYSAMPDIDGALVGGASLQIDSFIGITQAFIKSNFEQKGE
ncbi:triose-phosphate isomerase [Bacillus carboniphilus]|uniref:Triosephosphate isomerase n=1 Tax=Bacillus carboniphilus TaxID=86663 RepID=A0ABN0WHT0_9BACI